MLNDSTEKSVKATCDKEIERIDRDFKAGFITKRDHKGMIIDAKSDRDLRLVALEARGH